MKITRVTPIFANRYLYVQIETDEGLIGTGECGAWGHLEAAATAVGKFATYLIGKDPGRIETHWTVMHRFGHFTGAAICGAISAIDIALWDIKGKALGVPIHVLLGGPTRDRVRVYAHVKSPTKDEMIDAALQRKDQGYTAIGHLNPFLDEAKSEVYTRGHARKIDEAVQVIADIRAAVGPEMDLCVEIHRRLTPPEATAFAREIAQFRPMFYEDPIPPTSTEAMGRVADNIGIPLATGERFFSLYQFQAHIQRGALDYARVSLCLCGGITGARKIAALAEAHDIQVVPHNPLSPISLLACLQLDAAISNFAIQELPLVTQKDGATGHENRLRGSDLVDWTPDIRDGYLSIPQGPGLGAGLANAAYSAENVVREIEMRPHLDGSFIDQ
ncbi:galactonate dehydratase [Alterinioella nitratireducens]|uniref:galactonate dehydratase n=2 Tax=Alterinioella nitratireducens TaxID=2735915 RepID=UPI004057FCAE